MFDKSLLKLANIRKVLAILSITNVIYALLLIVQASTLSLALVHLWEKQKLAQQIWLLLVFAVCFILRHLMTWLNERYLDSYTLKAAKQLRLDLLHKVFSIGPRIVQEQGTGNMVTMALDGVEQFENYLKLILNKMIAMSVVPWLILIWVFYLDWVSGLILLLVFPLIILFMIILGYAAQAKADRQYQTFQHLSNQFVDSLRGIETLKYFGLSKSYAKRIHRISDNFRKVTLSTLKVAMLSTFALDFFTTLSIAIVAVMLGLRLLNGHILLFPALTVLVLAPEYFLPVRNFANDYHATLDGKNAYLAIKAVLDEPEPKAEPIQIGEWNNDQTLTLADIEFSYPDATHLNLEPINLSFKGTEKVGIIGMSGAGKSTLMNLLAGFLNPTAGQFIFNQTQSTNSLNQRDWLKQSLYIPQKPYIFDASLLDNIRFYTPTASVSEVEQAAKLVGLDQLISELPEGLDTRIGNGARPLSGGQAQRIALARAFLDKKRKVLLFDEPTAHLDIETELELKDEMLPIMENRLVFFATHRLHWLRQMDRIIVLEAGKIVEVGTFPELLAEKGYFYQLMQEMRGESSAE